MMGQKPDAKLTAQITREVCQRTTSAAVLEGSIAQVGAQYSLILKAVDCSSGKSFTSTEALADDKSRVLDALGRAASEIRKRLGESLNTVQRYNTPLEQATTPSLEALQAYNLGLKSKYSGDSSAAIPLLQQATKLDQNFAMAYAVLGMSYWNQGQSGLAAENIRKAFELRARVTEPEKLIIEANYYSIVTGNLEKAQHASEVWAQTYPRDWDSHSELGMIYAERGQYDKSLEEFNNSIRLGHDNAAPYVDVASAQLALNLFAESHATIQAAMAKNLDSPILHSILYLLAFLEGDPAGMARQVSWGAGKSGQEDLFLVAEADTAAYSGHLRQARILSLRAVALAEATEQKETAASYEADAALREALFGNVGEARQRAASTLRLSTSRDVQFGVALALVLSGDATKAQTLGDDLNKRFPEDTTVQFNYLPTLHAQLALNLNDPSKAIA